MYFKINIKDTFQIILSVQVIQVLSEKNTTVEFSQNQSRQGIQAFSNNLCGSPSLSRCSADAVFLDKQTQSRRIVERPTVDSIIFLFFTYFFSKK